jgi:iron complex transport system substrate-binding protein
MPSRSSVVLFAALLVVSLGLLPAMRPARAADFIDAAGRRVTLPDHIGRVLPAERNAEVLLYVLAPDALGGIERIPQRSALAHRPFVLDWEPRTSPAQMVIAARQVGAQVIIDAGTVTPDRAAYADAVQQQSGIPYILVDDSFARMPAMLSSIGAILNVTDRAADLATFAEHSIAGLRGRLLIRAPNTRPRVYYGLGYDGLQVPLPGSPADAAISEAGAINVAGQIGRDGETRITPAQLLAWDPEVVIAGQRSFYDQLRRGGQWRRLTAVREHHVYLEPTNPFGWIEDPSGVNRLIGLYWLSSLFYADATQEDLRSTACDFYNRFYRIKLTNAQLEAMVIPAGAAPGQAQRSLPEPLVGLGAAPPSSLATPSIPTPGSATPSAPTPGAPGAPPIPGLPNSAPTAGCNLPNAGPTPQPLPGLEPTPSSMPNALPSTGQPAGEPGRRPRPSTAQP